MSRIFLSHSSFDKDFVGSVFEKLGAGVCEYDIKTFERNADLTIQLRGGLGGCDIYVLFLSKAAISSGWVNAELDLANEFKMQWKVKKFFVFQLDDAKWSELPVWVGRYVVSCPPSPQHVALRLLDEINPLDEADVKCYGREEDVKRILTDIQDQDNIPAFLYLSGPSGIGRRTLAGEVYAAYYGGIARHKIEINIDSFDGIIELYKKILAYSANWRAYDFNCAVDDFSLLTEKKQIEELARLIREVSVVFRQVVMIDLGESALNEYGDPQSWFIMLMNALIKNEHDYPYVLFLSRRFLNNNDFPGGVFYPVNSLDEDWSRTLFRVLIKFYNINFPDKNEQRNVEDNIVGHPGLIKTIANYLRRNPNYKPNKTHNNIIAKINDEVQSILKDFISGSLEREKAVAFFAEAHILSYQEIKLVTSIWASFGDCVEALMDAGLVIRSKGDYYLVDYIQRYSLGLAERHRKSLTEFRKVLLSEFNSMDEGSFVSIQLLDSRIVECIMSDCEMKGYASNLIMPSQQIKASKRKYDEQDYKISLSLARLSSPDRSYTFFLNKSGFFFCHSLSA